MRISEDDLARLKLEAEREGVTVAVALRRLIREHLPRHDGAARDDAAPEVAGLDGGGLGGGLDGGGLGGGHDGGGLDGER